MDISSIGNGRDFLTAESLSPLASIFATAPSPRTSEQYRQVKTIEIIGLFADQGWFPVTAQEQRVNKAERDGFQKHLIRFRNKDMLPVGKDSLLPEIVLKNAHDATTAYQLMAGIFRMICLNGMVVSEAHFATIRITHKGFEPKQIRDVTSQFADQLPGVMDKVNEYRQISLSPDERTILAESALELKVDPPEDIVPMRLENGLYKIGERTFDTKRLLSSRRAEDNDPTLWNVHNVIQEKLTKGNRYEVDDSGWSGKKVRAIKSVDETVRVNRGLWHLMSEMAKLKGATA